MDHRPYEDWLLNDERLNLEQDRDLRAHLRTCQTCTALAQANLALRSSTVIAPAEGFALRFQARLAVQHKVQRRQTLIGLCLLAVVGLAGFIWLLLPYLLYLALPPAQISSFWISNLIYVALTARALGALGATLLFVLGSIVPTYFWAITLALLGGLGLLWIFSFRRVGKIAASIV